jgi:hypothetical protein
MSYQIIVGNCITFVVPYYGEFCWFSLDFPVIVDREVKTEYLSQNLLTFPKSDQSRQDRHNKKKLSKNYMLATKNKNT